MKVFPTCLFAPDDQQADIERRTISGGESLSGDEDLIQTDGGGRVFYEIGNPFLDDVPAALAWRALDAYQDGGSRAIIVPFCDARHQPTNGRVDVPHSDEATFSDETEYSQGDASAEIAAVADLRATAIELRNLVLARNLLGGEWLSIDHPVMRWRAYRVAEILELDADAGTAKLAIRPPLREAVSIGEAVDFTSPRCVMRLDGSMPSPMNMGYTGSTGARFVEHFPGPEGY
jgi:hypothetical protein